VVTVSDEVWIHERKIAESANQWIVAMRLGSDLDDDSAAAVVSEAVAKAVGETESKTAPGGNGGERAGMWSVDAEPAGVIVRQWGFVSDFPEVMRRIAAALDAVRIEGRFEPYEQPPPLPLDEGVLGHSEELLECHLRVGGERRLHRDPSEDELARRLGRKLPPGEVRWFPGADELQLGIEAALKWIANSSPRGALRVLVNGDLQTALSVDEARGRIAAAAADVYAARPPIAVWWESPYVFRLMRLGLVTGDISMVEGGASLAEGSWRSPYEALLRELRQAASWAAYGFIKRGRHPGHVLRSSLTYDWVPALHYGSYNLSNSCYEDVLAPDVFGAQLLGRGYAGRIPRDPDWTSVDLDNGATLVDHHDPEAWFGQPLPPITPEDCIALSPSYPTPDVIVRGRDAFAGILLTATVVREGALDPLA
jgi:hypothetical protein